MPDRIELTSINSVDLGTSRALEIKAEEKDRGSLTIVVTNADAQNLAVQFLCAGAVEASSPRPPAGTRMAACHLPLVSWRVGRSRFNGEPILSLHSQEAQH